MATGAPFHGVFVDTNATRVDAPVVLKAAEVCVVSGVPFKYPRLLTTLTGPCTVMVTVAVLLLVVPSLALKVNASWPM